jgi:type VI protein secretion system component VasK
MTQNKVMKLWTVIVTAFIALCTALGLVTTTATTAAAAAPSSETTRNSATASLTVPAMSFWAWTYARSLPPTMKQRIRAEAHGKSPSCRHRLLDAADADAPANLSGDDAASS